jgi:hypothetical protein
MARAFAITKTRGFCHSSYRTPVCAKSRGRDSGQTVHPQSRPRHHLARLLGYSGRDPLYAHAGDYQDHLRRPLAALGHFLERGETQPLSEALFYLAYIAEFILHQFLHSLVLISGLSCKTTFKPALPRAARRGQANDNQNNVRHFVSFRAAHIHRPALAQRPRGR